MPVTYPFHSTIKKRLSDTTTPVSIYLRIRDRYPNSILLESADYQPGERCFSYICCDPISEFKVAHEQIHEHYPDGTKYTHPITERKDVERRLQAFCDQFSNECPPEFDFLANGFFGYMAYDCIRYFDELNVQDDPDDSRDIPDIIYNVYRFIIAIDHYKNELFLIENTLKGSPEDNAPLTQLEYLIDHKDFPSYPFKVDGEEFSNFVEDEYIDAVEQCKKHIFRGDVFQIVPSRRFSQPFQGDEFNVYRALRSINPSPYLFYFDYGNFKLFGSSPEAQLVIQNNKASLHPIAGTYKRTGDQDVDMQAIEALRLDPKENAEHVMLVDLARNDLSKHCHDVHVEVFKQVQLYSHVIHLTSKVTGTMGAQAQVVSLLSDTFPMGTLSGAPKYRALELLDRYEKGRRRAYGGAIGNIGFDGSCNHAIIIRSFLSKQNVLHSQAGGGVVTDSDPHSELQEVNNKLRALKTALAMAEEI